MKAANWMDPAAMALSGLCLVHCLALPALSLALPLMGVWAQAEWVHLVVIALAAPLAILALRARATRGYLMLALSGLTLMVVAVVAPVSQCPGRRAPTADMGTRPETRPQPQRLFGVGAP